VHCKLVSNAVVAV